MNKKNKQSKWRITILLVIILFVLVKGAGLPTARAVESSAPSVKIQSKYINDFLWHGYHVADDIFIEKVTLKLDSLDLSAAWLNPLDDVEDVERYDLSIGHSWEIGELTARIGFDWILYSELDVDDGFDVQAATATLAHSTGLYYVFAHLWPTNGSSETEAGQVHVAGIQVEAGPLTLFGDITYNDQFSPFGGERVDDFSHTRAGVMLGDETGLRAVYYHQHAMNDAFENEEVVGIGYVVGF